MEQTPVMAQTPVTCEFKIIPSYVPMDVLARVKQK